MKWVFVWALVLFTAGCSGLRGQARDLYEQGAYREAIQTYEAILQQDPNDAEALAGLKKARTTFIDKKLIEVRKARMGANRQLALDTLLEICQLENAWSYYPGGPMANTQEEESAEAMRFVETQVGDSITKERPLFGLYLLTHYKPIFSGSFTGRREYLLRGLHKAGKKQCDGLARQETPTQPYYSEFVRKVCVAWGLPGQGKATGAAAKRATLYKALSVQSAITGFPEPYQRAMRSALDRAFRETPWFDPKGARTLSLNLHGRFHLEHQREREHRVHGYTVQVPYTAYEEVTKTRQVPYTDSFSKQTRYRTETYSEQQPVTRTQSIPRTQNYDGIAHHQELEWRAQGDLKLASLSRTLLLDATSEKEGFEHHWNLPNIGLYPEKADLEDPDAWVRHHAERLASDLRAQSDDVWENLYCQPQATDPTLVATGDLVHRCLRLRVQSPPDFASAWYDKFVGLSVEQAHELLKLSEL